MLKPYYKNNLLILSACSLFFFLSGCAIFSSPTQEVYLPHPSDFVSESTPTQTETDTASEELVTPPTPETPKDETGAQKIYTVDEFVEYAFATKPPVYIQADSVTCYKGSCGLNGKEWGISLDNESSSLLLPYNQTTTPIIVSATPDCAADIQTCHSIKNVTIEKILEE